MLLKIILALGFWVIVLLFALGAVKRCINK